MNEKLKHALYAIVAFFGFLWVGSFMLYLTPDGQFPEFPIFLTMLLGMMGSLVYGLYCFFTYMDEDKKW